MKAPHLAFHYPKADNVNLEVGEEIEILLVEDSITDASMIVRALQKSNLNYKLLHLKDGAETLDFLFAKGKFDDKSAIDHLHIILLDLKMPKIEGIEVLRQLKSNARTKNIPVVVFSSSNENTDMQVCYDLGVNSYVPKPLEYDKFQEVVVRLVFYWLKVNQLSR